MNKKQMNPIVRVVILGVLITSILMLITFASSTTTAKMQTLTYSELEAALNNDQIQDMVIQPDYGIYSISGKMTLDDGSTAPYRSDIIVEDADAISQLAYEKDVNVTAEPQKHQSALGSLFMTLLVFGLMFMGISWLMKRMTSGKNSPLAVGEHNARLNAGSDKKFKDVIGYEEEKMELFEIVDFLKNPEYYVEMGAKIPSGVLLEGPPGTGKTLMAKAVAGEAGVNFYSISGSDFIEMFVGVGASRVRNLFKEANKNAPAIVFIDEIDAIGSRDSGAPGGRNTEQEQTINALLVELDGFAQNALGKVIIIGATNRADKLDPALLRVGRFDRKIVMGYPELKAREDILKYHSQTRNMADDVDFKDLARSTTGMAGSNLEGVINEAAILAVRKKSKLITNSDLHEAIDRVLMGPAKVNNKYSERDKKMVSYHESGHAIIGLDLEEGNQVQKITIIPRGHAGGYVAYVPKEDEERFTTKSAMEASIISLMGGRASEELFIGDVTLGAHNDFEQATSMARAMVTQFGMSRLGHIQYEMRNSNQFIRQYSEETAREIDQVISEIIEVSYDKAKEILLRRSDDVRLLADTICEKESMTKTEIDYLLEHRVLPQEVEVETYSDEEISEMVQKQKDLKNVDSTEKSTPEVSDSNITTDVSDKEDFSEKKE